MIEPTLQELLKRSRDWLGERGVDNAVREADELAARAMGCTRMDLYLAFDSRPDEGQRKVLRDLLKRRARGEPLQYLLGNQPFRKAELRVDSRVLIPRPETEQLVDLILAAECAAGPLTVLDGGTGSGCIAISLAQELPDCTVKAVDIHPAALELARENAASNGVADRIRFRRIDLLRDTLAEPVDVFVSNPPYVSPSDNGRLQPELSWEPQDALYANDNGLLFYRHYARTLAGLLKPGGRFYFEIGETQAEELLTMYHGIAEQVQVHQDLAGRDRFISGRLRPGKEEPEHG